MSEAGRAATRPDIDAIKRRAEAATYGGYERIREAAKTLREEDVPALVDYVLALEARIARLERTCNCYLCASGEVTPSACGDCDCGVTAAERIEALEAALRDVLLIEGAIAHGVIPMMNTVWKERIAAARALVAPE